MEISLEPVLYFRLIWPDIKLNSDDSEFEIFRKYFRSLKSKVKHMTVEYMKRKEITDCKSVHLAKSLRSQGDLWKIFDYTEAFNYYTKSLVVSPFNSKEYGLALGNRSAVLFEMKQYKECLLDINRLFKSQYPENLKYKVYLRETKCYLELFDYTKAKECLDKTEQFFENAKKKMRQFQIDDFTEKIDENRNQLEKPIIEESTNDSSREDLFHNSMIKNPNFLNASIAVEIRRNEEKGRYVVAASDIKKGDILFVEEPYAFAYKSDAYKSDLYASDDLYESDRYRDNDHCAHCLYETKTLIPCKICIEFLYCSEECQSVSWNESHQWICNGIRRGIISTDHMHLSLNMLFKAARNGFKTEIKDDSIYADEQDNHPFLSNLVTHKDQSQNDLLQSVQLSCWLVLYLKHFTDYFNWLRKQENCPQGSREELYDIVGGNLLKYLLQIPCNSELIMDGVVEMFYVTLCYKMIARAIYISTALINHSCLPNAAQSYDNNLKIVRALTDIAKGSEINVSYTAESPEFSTEKRREALKRYNFICKCQACTDPNLQERNNYWSCPKCKGPAPRTDCISICRNCFRNFDFFDYKMAENKYMYKLLLCSDLIELNRIYNVMKDIFYKDNHIFTLYYIKRYKIYEEKYDDYKTCSECFEQVAEINKAVYGETSTPYCTNLSKYIITLCQYCITLRQEDGVNYNKVLEKTKNTLKTLCDLLKFYISQKHIDLFEAEVMKYMYSEDVLCTEHELLLNEGF